MKKRKKRAMTLLEVMIVIFIIGIIGSVIGYNMRGSMDQGKAFKTKESISKVYNIVHLELGSHEIKALGQDSTVIKEAVERALERSGLVNRPSQYLVDGWKNDLEFTTRKVKGSYEIRMRSEKYETFCEEKDKPFDYPWDEEDTDAS